jgi:hypothetical protein
MDLVTLLSEIPDGRELSLSRKPEGILIQIDDYDKGTHARKLIPCADVARAVDFDKLFINRLRLVNAMLDHEIKDRPHG